MKDILIILLAFAFMVTGFSAFVYFLMLQLLPALVMAFVAWTFYKCANLVAGV